MSLSEQGRTYSPQDLVEMGLKEALFGEVPALGEFSAHMARMENPWELLTGLRISDELIRPIGHVLLTEALVGSGKASRITTFRLGPSVAGRRRFELGWVAPRRYEDVNPEKRRIEGSMLLK